MSTLEISGRYGEQARVILGTESAWPAILEISGTEPHRAATQETSATKPAGAVT